MKDKINIKIGGMAGVGIKITGLTLSKIFTRLGFDIYAYDEYPSLVRGGHNCYQILVSANEVYSQEKEVDILIALDKETVDLHQDELSSSGIIIYDPEKFELNGNNVVGVPFEKLALENGGNKIMANMVSVGAMLAFCSLSMDVFETLIWETFKNKGEEMVASNKKAARAGYEFVVNNFANKVVELKPGENTNQLVMTGNEAVGLGAVAGGVKYYAAYPMTPATSVLHYLAKVAREMKIVVNHCENEIAAVNSALGASVAGVRAMTGTSGGGFCLMIEGMGMAGVGEIPLTILMSSRPGPASGMPTWTAQGDLKFMINASQDEFPRFVFTPGDAQECFEFTKRSLELAEKWQVPSVILIDKVISESHYAFPAPQEMQRNTRAGFIGEINGNYLRYQDSENGVSPRPRLGQKGGHCLLGNSYEHGENSLYTESASERVKQVNKRAKKMKGMLADLPSLPVYGDKNEEIMLVGYGSTVGPVRQALKNLSNVAYLHFNYAWPFPIEQVKEVLEKAAKIYFIEGNSMGQLESLVKEQTGIVSCGNLHKYDGRPFYPHEIIEFVNEAKNKSEYFEKTVVSK